MSLNVALMCIGVEIVFKWWGICVSWRSQKRMTGQEIAIMVAVALIVAAAIGWNLNTTFVASYTEYPRLDVVSAELSVGTRQLTVKVVNSGPVNVQISKIELNGTVYSVQKLLEVGRNATITVTVNGTYTPGTMLQGKVILSSGESFPFMAAVMP